MRIGYRRIALIGRHVCQRGAECRPTAPLAGRSARAEILRAGDLRAEARTSRDFRKTVNREDDLAARFFLSRWPCVSTTSPRTAPFSTAGRARLADRERNTAPLHCGEQIIDQVLPRRETGACSRGTVVQCPCTR